MTGEPGGRGHAGPVPGAAGHGPHPAPGRRRRRRRRGDLAETAEELQGALVGRVGARVLRDPDSSGGHGPSRQATGEPAGRERSLREPPVVAPEGQGEAPARTGPWPGCSSWPRPGSSGCRYCCDGTGASRGTPGPTTAGGPGPRAPPVTSPRIWAGWPPGPATRWPGWTGPPGPRCSASRRSTWGGRWPSCSGARPRPCSPAPPSRSGSPSDWAWSGSRSTSWTVGSPFDYRSHSLLYVARHLPDRRRPESEPALHDELEALIRAAGGRTLALFTSWRATEAAASALRPRLPYPVLAQGELPKGRLLERLRRGGVHAVCSPPSASGRGSTCPAGRSSW